MILSFPQSITLTLESGIDPAETTERRFAAGETVEVQGVTIADGAPGWVDIHFLPECGFTRGWRACGVHESAVTVVSS